MTVRALSPEILKASKKAASHVYDKSKYIVMESHVRRDGNTGRLVSEEKKHK